MDEESVETSEVIVRPIPTPATVFDVYFYVLDDSPTGCAAEATDANIREGLRLANERWASSNILFRLGWIYRNNSPRLKYLSDTTSYSASQMSGEITGGMGGTRLWFLGPGARMTPEEWLNWDTDFVQHPSIYVPCNEATEQWFGHARTRVPVAHIPAPFVNTAMVGHLLGLALHLY